MELIQLGLRSLQLFWIILLTALLGNVIATAHNSVLVANSAVNYSMFVTVLAWLAALYGLALALVSSLAIPIVVLAIDAAVVLFSFIAAIVLAAELKPRDCSRLSSITGLEKKCRELQASTAFMWFLFATFLGSLAMAVMAFKRTGARGAGAGGPSMKQVHVVA